DTFDLASVTGEAALVFQHLEAGARFGASVFWTRRCGAIGGGQAMIEYWQVRRGGGPPGIVGIPPEGTRLRTVSSSHTIWNPPTGSRTKSPTCAGQRPTR